MLTAAQMNAPAAAVAAARSYLRLFGNEEDALAATCVASAMALCEQFVGQALLVREHQERLAAGEGWTMLGASPVRSIGSVARSTQEGGTEALPNGAYLVDIDVEGRGWVRVAGGGRVTVTYQAGLAAEWDGLPEALRHGIVRLAVHLFTQREGSNAAPPAAVSALWRPWRRMWIGGRHVRGA